ncbi:MAG TPA: acylneuraminate cytidylyltransferase family protein [Pyrinomonadaceae bacterium]
MKVLGLITARGGSKGVRRKNVRLLHGKPLLAYAIQASLSSLSINRTIISTEDEEIAQVGRKFGAEVPFIRPAELAQDTTPMFPVVEHALLALREQGDNYDAVCLLQPTNPLRRPSDIDACVTMLAESDADSVISVLPVPPEYNPHWVYWRGNDGGLSISTGQKEPVSRRQDLPEAVHRDGTVYVSRAATILCGKSLYGDRVLGYEVDPNYSVNIDTEDDWKEAEARLRVENE